MIQYDLQTSKKKINMVKSYFLWNGKALEISSREEYPVFRWNYTEEGYLFLEQYHMSGYDGASGYTALRIQPLDENDFGELDFYDLFDILYPEIYGNSRPYIPADDSVTEAVYYVPGAECEKVIMSRFKIDSKTLQSKTRYMEEIQSYEYRPRGLYDCEPSEIPYPEVVGYREGENGMFVLTVNAVYAEENSSKSYVHEVTIRVLPDGGFQYAANHVVELEEGSEEQWHVNRLTDKEWNEIYRFGLVGEAE